MIISCSRRTDIPALYSEWLMQRIRAGFCRVPNPFHFRQVSQVSLNPADVDGIVFWSKNPAPLRAHLPELSDRGYAFYFQYTLNDYPECLEPHLPSLEHRLHTFERLAAALGPVGLVWRYDPILLSDVTDVRFHEQTFSRLCRSLNGMTDRVMISFLSPYRKTRRRLASLKCLTLDDDPCMETRSEVVQMLGIMNAVARENGIEIQSCAAPRDLSEHGIAPGRCIDETRIALLSRSGRPLRYVPHKGQRDACRCCVSRDIGINDTCTHGCVYCYATVSQKVALQRSLRF